MAKKTNKETTATDTQVKPVVNNDNEVKATANVAQNTNTDNEVKATKKAEKEYLVETPVENFNGTVAGVQFAYGKAKVKAGWILDWFKEKGYKVTEVK